MIVSKVKYNPKQAKLEVQRRSADTRTGSDYSLKPAEKPVLQHQQARSAQEWLQSNQSTSPGQPIGRRREANPVFYRFLLKYRGN